ncbi:DUF5659 domain-containing protein [Tissierella pigra]|uniref:DUF5659 domain-containing protein n=1 Tax=Tissierella pigra TaxID=2607614 RepID=A0A6N7XH72_9FIRM|nr:DUF5659 domain-containing protein [Tissierella pigra]MSU01391.1 hypothetical protein [Tissierella pigra]
MEEKREKSELYFVTSPYLNAYLLSKGFEMQRVAKLDNEKIALFYKNTDELHNCIKEYRANKELYNYISGYRKVIDMFRLFKQQEQVKEMTELPFD